MKRKILFRGKRIEDNQWVYGDLTQNPCSAIFENRGHRGENNVIPETVGQFTGLKDKNGKMIFEGDRLHYGDPAQKYTVEFVNFGFHVIPDLIEKHVLSLYSWIDSAVVAGNIYDKEADK